MTSQIQLVQQDLKRNLNIGLQITKLDYTTYFGRYAERKWEGTIWGFQTGYAISLDERTYQYMHSKSPKNYFRQFLLPAAILGFRLSAATMRMTRSTLLEVLREDYVRTAWAKGLSERLIIYKHALKNALIPVVTIVGGQLGALLAGTVIIETIFALPGMGRLTVEAIIFWDYPVVQTNVMLVATTLVTLNLLVDLTYAWLDPRIRYQ
jgi:ABC-type dipeptide/oligopeptide/nickel transport system permease component